MSSSIRVVGRKQSASFIIVLSIVTIVPLWLMLPAANTSANAQTTSSPADWTEFHRDNMQRWNPYETVLGVSNAGSLHLKWKDAIGASSQFSPTSPSVVNGVVYLGSGDGNVYALNASTGAKLWSFSTGTGPVFFQPAVANGVVYVGSTSGGIDALNASTGALQWSMSIGTVECAPTVANGVVYVGSDIGSLYALNASTGAMLWSFDTGSGPVDSSPAVANGVIYFGSDSQISSGGNVYALNASAGTLLWSYHAGRTVFSSPAVANGVVYVGSADSNVYALNASTGAKLWSFTTGNGVESSPAAANGVVYIGSDDGNMYALNASTGAKLWSSATSGPVEFSSPAVANGVVYFGSDDQVSGGGNLYALNASAGTLLWSYHTGVTRLSSPTVVDGVVYMSAGISPQEGNNISAFALGSADLFLRIFPSATTVHQGDLLTFPFPVWNLGPDVAVQEVLNTQVPAGTTFDYIRISGTPGLGTCTRPPYGGTGQIICHENASMAPNTTWTVRLTVRVTAPSGTVITANAATMAQTPDPNMANNTATVSMRVQ